MPKLGWVHNRGRDRFSRSTAPPHFMYIEHTTHNTHNNNMHLHQYNSLSYVTPSTNNIFFDGVPPVGPGTGIQPIDFGKVRSLDFRGQVYRFFPLRGDGTSERCNLQGTWLGSGDNLRTIAEYMPKAGQFERRGKLVEAEELYHHTLRGIEKVFRTSSQRYKRISKALDRMHYSV
jgi:hypothetical protein